ncbi:MAG TPA: ATP-binding cassette domain-containing protein [Bacilli bacterium]|nr:ATP-binding cassette domain-containing protein [Bacilli bacterium]
MFQVKGLQFATGLNGVVGPKGVGKTRLLQTLSEMHATNDTVTDRGFSGKVCYLNGTWEGSQELTVLEYVTEAAHKREIASDSLEQQVRAVIECVLLTAFADHRVRELSCAMQRRVRLAEALLSDPQLLLLDDLLGGLAEQERMHFAHTLCELAKERIVVLASDVTETPEGLFDTVCLLHPDKEAVTVSAHTAYEWVEGKVWEYISPELPSASDGRIVSEVKRGTDAVCVREVATVVPYEEVSQVTPTLTDAYAWWVKCGS